MMYPADDLAALDSLGLTVDEAERDGLLDAAAADACRRELVRRQNADRVAAIRQQSREVSCDAAAREQRLAEETWPAAEAAYLAVAASVAGREYDEAEITAAAAIHARGLRAAGAVSGYSQIVRSRLVRLRPRLAKSLVGESDSRPGRRGPIT